MISFDPTPLLFNFSSCSPRLRLFLRGADKETIIVRKDNIKEAKLKLKLSVSYASRQCGGVSERVARRDFISFSMFFHFGAHDEEPEREKALSCT